MGRRASRRAQLERTQARHIPRTTAMRPRPGRRHWRDTKLLQDGAPLMAFANIGATLVAWFIAGLLVIALARLVIPE